MCLGGNFWCYTAGPEGIHGGLAVRTEYDHIRLDLPGRACNVLGWVPTLDFARDRDILVEQLPHSLYQVKLSFFTVQFQERGGSVWHPYRRSGLLTWQCGKLMDDHHQVYFCLADLGKLHSHIQTGFMVWVVIQWHQDAL